MNKYKNFMRHYKEIRAWDEKGFVGHWMRWGDGFMLLVGRMDVWKKIL